jgi:hypothetical protein
VRASLALTSTTLNPQWRAMTWASVVLPVPAGSGGGGVDTGRQQLGQLLA